MAIACHSWEWHANQNQQLPSFGMGTERWQTIACHLWQMACNQMPSKGLGTFDGERLVAWSATIGWVSKPNTNHCRMPNGMPSSLFGKPIVGDGLGFHHRLWLAKPNASIKQSSNDCWMLAIFWDWLPNGIHHLRWHETKWHAIFWETKWHQTKWQTQLPSIDDAITNYGWPSNVDGLDAIKCWQSFGIVVWNSSSKPKAFDCCQLASNQMPTVGGWLSTNLMWVGFGKSPTASNTNSWLLDAKNQIYSWPLNVNICGWLLDGNQISSNQIIFGWP